MKNNDMINLRREKLRNLLQQEMEDYQYEVFSNNNSSQLQYLLDKFTAFNNYNNKNKSISEDININFYDNNFLNNNNNLQFGNQNNINNIDLNNQNVQNPYMNNTISLNRQQFMESNQQNDINNNMSNNNKVNYNFGNIDLDTQINNYNSHYNKLRIDEFMSKKIIQDDLLNKINQKLNKINKDINDKVYQENLAAQWKQNNQNPQ